LVHELLGLALGRVATSAVIDCNFVNHIAVDDDEIVVEFPGWDKALTTWGMPQLYSQA
jgi:hypothetical protein